MTEAYRIFSDGAALPGSGWRTVLVKEGRKFIQVLDWTTLESKRILSADFYRNKPERVELSSKAVRTIKRTIKHRLQWVSKTKFIKEILDGLDQAKAGGAQ